MVRAGFPLTIPAPLGYYIVGGPLSPHINSGYSAFSQGLDGGAFRTGSAPDWGQAWQVSLWNFLKQEVVNKQ